MRKLKSRVYPLTTTAINLHVEHRIGNYELGYLNKGGYFVTKYVGRSDCDINSRLKDHIGKYPAFRYLYAESAEEAYRIEANDYIYYGGWIFLDNEIHPDSPSGHNIWRGLKRIHCL